MIGVLDQKRVSTSVLVLLENDYQQAELLLCQTPCLVCVFPKIYPHYFQEKTKVLIHLDRKCFKILQKEPKPLPEN